MSITFQGTTSAFAGSSSSVSTTIDTTGLSDVSVVMFSFVGPGVTTNTPTFNAVSFTRVSTEYTIVGGPSAGTKFSMWVISNASIGTSRSVSLTANSAAHNIGFGIIWYSGTHATQPDSFTTMTESTTTLASQATTIINNGSWLSIMGQQSSGPTAGANTTLRETSIGYMADSNGPLTPGSQTLNIGQPSSGVISYGSIGIRPLVPPANGNMLNFM